MALLLATQRTASQWGIGVAGTAALLFVVQLATNAPRRSSRGAVAEIIHTRAPNGARVFFRASDEYQLCEGSSTTSGSRSTFWPPGVGPSDILAGRTERLFTSPAELARVWREGGTFWVSDDVTPPGAEGKLAPGPHTLVARAGSRVLLQGQ